MKNIDIKNRHFFISYRHKDGGEYAEKILSKLKITEPSCNVFLDKSDMVSGFSFTLQIKDELSKADMLILLITPYWETKEGKSKLNKTDDILCREIFYALRHHLPILPILIEETKMPEVADLPDDIFVLHKIHAEKLSMKTFNHDFNNILETIFRMFSEKDHLEKIKSDKMAKLNKLMKSDPDKHSEEMQKIVDQLRPDMPQFIEVKSVSGEGIKESWINLCGIWKSTAKVQGNTFIIQFMILDEEETRFNGKITLTDNWGQTLRKSEIKGTWAKAIDTDKDLFLGFFLTYIEENQTHIELLIPFHQMVGNSVVGKDSNGVEFVSINIEPRAQGF